ncbi:hypothetical protein AAMO2058_000263400 [Amorphochlora amoebiformis]
MSKRKANPTLPRKRRKKDKSELELEAALFATSATPSHPEVKDPSEIKDVPEDDWASLPNKMKEAKPAWVDEHDEEVKVDISAHTRLRKLRDTETESEITGTELTARLRRQFKKINQTNDLDWAKLPTQDDTKDGLESVVRTTRGLLAREGDDSNPIGLPPKEIKVVRAKDANMTERSQGVVRSVRFHPNGQVIMTAGLDKTLRLFNIDGLRNPKLLSVTLDGFPIYSSDFTADGRQVVCTSRRHHFYSIDVETGKVSRVPGIKGRRDKSFEVMAMARGPNNPYFAVIGNSGNILILDQKTKQYIFQLKANAPIANCSFSSDGYTLHTICEDGEIYRWDLRSRRCIGRHQDHASHRGTSIACSLDGSYYACGSSSGVANLYDYKSGQSSKVEPVKAFMNLTTPLDQLAFNSTGEILAMASSRAKDAFRLAHISSRSVFSNWPTIRTPLNYVTALEFSPNSGYLAVGNAKGRVLLYRLTYYSSA